MAFAVLHYAEIIDLLIVEFGKNRLAVGVHAGNCGRKILERIAEKRIVLSVFEEEDIVFALLYFRSVEIFHVAGMPYLNACFTVLETAIRVFFLKRVFETVKPVVAVSGKIYKYLNLRFVRVVLFLVVAAAGVFPARANRRDNGKSKYRAYKSFKKRFSHNFRSVSKILNCEKQTFRIYYNLLTVSFQYFFYLLYFFFCLFRRSVRKYFLRSSIAIDKPRRK